MATKSDSMNGGAFIATALISGVAGWLVPDMPSSLYGASAALGAGLMSLAGDGTVRGIGLGLAVGGGVVWAKHGYNTVMAKQEQTHDLANESEPVGTTRPPKKNKRQIKIRQQQIKRLKHDTTR